MRDRLENFAAKMLFIGLALLGTIHAQTPTPSPTPPKPTPVLSEIEQLKLENLELKLSNIQQQAQQVTAPLQQQRSELIAAIVKEHPGYQWHEAIAQGDREGLRPIVAPPAPKTDAIPPDKANQK